MEAQGHQRGRRYDDVRGHRDTLHTVNVFDPLIYTFTYTCIVVRGPATGTDHRRGSGATLLLCKDLLILLSHTVVCIIRSMLQWWYHVYSMCPPWPHPRCHCPPHGETLGLHRGNTDFSLFAVRGHGRERIRTARRLPPRILHRHRPLPFPDQQTTISLWDAVAVGYDGSCELMQQWRIPHRHCSNLRMTFSRCGGAAGATASWTGEQVDGSVEEALVGQQDEPAWLSTCRRLTRRNRHGV